MSIYLIRHAPTYANICGKMVKNYNSYDIYPFDKRVVLDKIITPTTCLSYSNIFISKTNRAKQTAKILFPKASGYKVLKELNEFDCSGIGDQAFWEMSEEDFNKQSGLTSKKIRDGVEKLLNKLSKLEDKYGEDIICIGHGLKFRAVLRYCKIASYGIRPEPKDFNPYRLINSMDEQIRNLDTLKIDLNHRTYKVIKRSEKFNPETHDTIKQ